MQNKVLFNAIILILFFKGHKWLKKFFKSFWTKFCYWTRCVRI